MSLTEEIYRELVEGLRTGLDYDSIRLKHENSKGLFYNAVKMVFAYVGERQRLNGEVTNLKEQRAHLEDSIEAFRPTAQRP